MLLCVKQARIGRPPIAPEDRRNVRLDVRLTQAELEVVRDAAELVDKSPATWAHNVIVRAAKRKTKRA